MKFRSNAMLVAVLLALLLSLGTQATAQSIKVVIDGQPVDFTSTPPFEQNDSVLVPLRGVFEALGAGVNYSSSTHTVEATKGQTDVILRLGDATATINGQAAPLLQPPLVVNGSMFVPLRFVAQSFGAIVNWTAATQTVDIHTPGASSSALSVASSPGPPPSSPAVAVESAADQDSGNGPVRLARFSDVNGTVMWRPTGDTNWSPASCNIPLTEGTQIWAGDGGRSEIQFDDGSWLRLGQNAVAIVRKLTSNSDGEFTDIQLSRGVASLELRADVSVYQIDTTLVSVKAHGPARFRVNADNGVAIAIRAGSAEVIGPAGKERLGAGSYLRMANAGDMYNVGALPGDDDWDKWSDSRDAYCDHPDRNLPPNIGLVAGDLNHYGDWNQDSRYGSVWTPRNQDPSWRPYENGHWVWVDPFGWTWVATEPWGWAPYHYGTWIHEPYGWSWVPGPKQQYWSPAVVHFSEYHDNVCWAPLAPSEVRYPPTIAVSLHGHDWSLNFSIGGCAVYYPTDSHSCVPRPWTNRQANHRVGQSNVTNIYNNRTTINNVTQNVYVTKYVFVPANGAAGATSTSASTFGHAGNYHPVVDPTGSAFRQGRSVGAPDVGMPPTGGPVVARPTRESLSPARAFSPAPPEIELSVKLQAFRAPILLKPAPTAPPVTKPTPAPPTAKPTPPVSKPTPAPPVTKPAPAPPTAKPTPPVSKPTPAPPVSQPAPAPTPPPAAGPAGQAQAPQITKVSPETGAPGTVVTLTGSNLTGVTALWFNGVTASYTIVDKGKITATAPTNVTTGPITIKTKAGLTARSPSFTVTK